MPVNGYTVGRDVTVNMVGPDGVNIILSPEQITNFTAKPLKREDWSRPLNSPPQPLYMPDGWKITIACDRKDASLDSYQSDVEQAYWSGQNMLAGTILQTVIEANGTTTQYRFDSVQFWIEEPGNYVADGKVNQHIEASAATRKRVK